MNLEVACGSCSTSSTWTARLTLAVLASLTASTSATSARSASFCVANVTSTMTVTGACNRRWLRAAESSWACPGTEETRRRRRPVSKVVLTLYVIETTAESTARPLAARIASTLARSAASSVESVDATENSKDVW